MILLPSRRCFVLVRRPCGTTLVSPCVARRHVPSCVLPNAGFSALPISLGRPCFFSPTPVSHLRVILPVSLWVCMRCAIDVGRRRGRPRLLRHCECVVQGPLGMNITSSLPTLHWPLCGTVSALCLLLAPDHSVQFIWQHDRH
jgi:hypothetical protein